MAVVVGVIFVLMIFLVPQLAATFKTLAPKLPRETEILIALSGIFVRYWYLLIGVPVAAGFALFAAAQTHEGVQRAIETASIRLPVVGAIRFKIMLARFSTFFAMLYRSGISVLDCIQICEKIMGNRLMEEALQRVGRSISDGQGISQAFTATKLFPPLVLRMLRVGESTGGLDTALLNVSYFYNREVREGIAKMQSLIGPATTIVLGGLIFAILYTIFLPLYDVISKIKF
jgi:type IV pilus assembly protein PilC